MSIVTMLALQDDQIDVVADAVCRWCKINNQDINSDKGRAVMQIAVAMALVDKWQPEEFERRLASQIS